MAEIESDVLIVGGGLGGVAAALAAARHGHRVVLTEVTDWLGGQLTQQAVPPDEHPYIEQFGCTRTYRLLRHRIRELYRAYYPLTREARSDPHLNPGNGWVSGLCHEPRVALLAIESLLMPLQSSGLLRVLLHHEPIDAETDGDRVLSVRLQDCNGGEDVVACAPLMLDATETGELLSLTKTEYVTGAESRSETAEPHASHERRQLNMQAITFCFAIDHLYGEDHTIDRPERYGFWRSYKAPFWPGRQLGLNSPEPQTLEPLEHTFTPNPNLQDGRRGPASKELWLFRRIADRANFAPGRYKSDITLVNWPMIDYFDGPILDVPQQEASRHLDDARQLSLSFLYWLQTEAPRPDGGEGYPGLRLRADVVGTKDGLAKHPYIRESRRIRALYTVVEQDVAAEVRGDAGAVLYPDSVGIGSYRIDLHPSTGGDNYVDIPACPFELPLGALLPVRVRNLIPASKNIGTTHVTNGCYRLHPVEWNVGEAAGLLSAYCLSRKVDPHQVREQEGHLQDFRSLLVREGIELHWPRVSSADPCP